MTPEIGLEDNQRKEIGSALAGILADTHRLYLKTHGYHWNVTGPMFRTLHLMFEEQYTQLFTAQDEIAERIRALGLYAPGTEKELSELSSLPVDTDVPPAESMIRNLVRDHEALSRSLRAVVAQAGEAGDDSTADLLTARLQEHEKNAWMLRSLLG